MGTWPDAENVPSVREELARLGVYEAGSRYFQAERAEDAKEQWILVAVEEGVDDLGDRLPIETWWELVLAALDACETDDDFFLLGERGFGSIWSVPGMLERTIEARATSPKLRRLYKVMRRRYRAMGFAETIWIH